MGHMPPESPIDLDTAPPGEVVEVGIPAPRRGSWSTAGLGRALAADRRLVPLAAALGALALLTSLISEWQVTTVDAALYGDGHVGNRMLRTDVTDLGSLGAAFLVGLFPLVATVVLAMFGPLADRRRLRLAGLSVGGTLLGLLVALTASIGSESRAIPRVYLLQLDDNQITVGYGRGLWCAFAGVALATLALYLVDRHLPAVPVALDDDEGDQEATAIWTWRRPPGGPDDRDPDEPLELTVAPVKPFTLADGTHGYPSEERHGPPVA